MISLPSRCQKRINFVRGIVQKIMEKEKEKNGLLTVLFFFPQVLCPAVLVKTRVCEGCSVSQAHKPFLRSILFCICLFPRLCSDLAVSSCTNCYMDSWSFVFRHPDPAFFIAECPLLLQATLLLARSALNSRFFVSWWLWIETLDILI